jgi:hypothetical protein
MLTVRPVEIYSFKHYRVSTYEWSEDMQQIYEIIIVVSTTSPLTTGIPIYVNSLIFTKEWRTHLSLDYIR